MNLYQRYVTSEPSPRRTWIGSEAGPGFRHALVAFVSGLPGETKGFPGLANLNLRSLSPVELGTRLTGNP